MGQLHQMGRPESGWSTLDQSAGRGHGLHGAGGEGPDEEVRPGRGGEVHHVEGDLQGAGKCKSEEHPVADQAEAEACPQCRRVNNRKHKTEYSVKRIVSACWIHNLIHPS